MNEYGFNCSQQDLMTKDIVICVSDNDDIVGAGMSKLEAHTITPNNPRGICHRAFSVFVLNSKNELLITQRSHEKITFPGIWSNSCCSHPLYNMIPDEASDGIIGVKNAAKRKMKHELGLHVSEFSVATRFYYFAKYNDLYCEHELDYVVFCKTDDIPKLNRDEMADYKYVSKDELPNLMLTMEFSEWFKKIIQFRGIDWIFAPNTEFDDIIYK